MELYVRRGLAVTFALIFLVVAPLSIAYGRGYRVDVKHRRVTLTGVIAVAGFPKRVQVSVDGQPQRTTSLPVTARGVLPGDHVVLIGAPGYGTQAHATTVRPGETVFLDDVQLIREQPVTTLRTGIPQGALLAPTGNAAAWVQDDRVVIAQPTGMLHEVTVATAASVHWAEDGEHLEIRNAENAVLLTLTRNGERQSSPAQLTALSDATRERIGESTPFTSLQRIPDGSGLFLTNGGTAWVLEEGKDTPELFSRWYEPVVFVGHLGRDVTVSVRENDLTVRNASNGQVTTIHESGIVSAVVTSTPGMFQALVRDGDLLRWVQAMVF